AASPDVARVRDRVRPDAPDEPEAFAADRAEVRLDSGRLPLLVLLQHHTQHVGVQAAAQPLVGGDDDDADALHRLALLQKGMLVLGARVRDMHSDLQSLGDVGARRAHAVLRLLHLRSRDHLHRLGDLPGVVHTPDFHPDFFGAWHQKLPFFFQSSIAAFRFFSSSAVRSFLSSTVFTCEAYLLFRWSRSDLSAASALAISRPSK